MASIRNMFFPYCLSEFKCERVFIGRILLDSLKYKYFVSKKEKVYREALRHFLKTV